MQFNVPQLTHKRRQADEMEISMTLEKRRFFLDGLSNQRHFEERMIAPILKKGNEQWSHL